MPSNDLSGNIVTTGSILYFVPSNTQRAPLRWDHELQQFTMIGDNSDDRGLCLFLRKMTVSEAFSETSPVNKSVSCCALYGVVSLGSYTSVLLYVTESERVAALSLSEKHEIYAVKKFAWLKLPPRVARLSRAEDIEDDREKKSENKEFIGYKSRELSPETIAEYYAVIDNFCIQANRYAGGSHFFYSSTINIALNPSEMLCTSRHSCERLSSSFEPDDLSSKSVFQWNIPLLHAFQTQNVPIAEKHEQHKHKSLRASLYVPSFIRGSVAVASANGVDLLLLSRLSFRWSGTRYNRRGLDPSGSGIAANFSISTLWVLPAEESRTGAGREATSATSATSGEGGGKGPEESARGAGSEDDDEPDDAPRGPPRRVAAYGIMRGSVPCRWSQPANLMFKPKVTISPNSGTLEELVSHIDALATCLPGLHSVHCLDTISLSSHEHRLSETFEEMVRQYRESDSKQRPSVDVLYTKYNLRKRMAQNVSYDQMRQEIRQGLQSGNMNSKNSCTRFSKWVDEEDDQILENNEGALFTCWRQVQNQESYVRVNCLDCLDRTNLAQSMIVLDVLPQMIRYVLGVEKDYASSRSETEDTPETTTDFLQEFGEASRQCKYLWSKQGISLSQIYAGSDAHFLHFLQHGKVVPYDFIDEGKLAFYRWWQQNFYDGCKQDAISLITHQHDPEHFNSKLESPFARRLSGMNKMVALGFLLAVGATGVNIFMAAIVPSFCSRREILMCEMFWAVYLAALLSHILKDAISYTNYPLLT